MEEAPVSVAQPVSDQRSRSLGVVITLAIYLLIGLVWVLPLYSSCTGCGMTLSPLWVWARSTTSSTTTTTSRA